MQGGLGESLEASLGGVCRGWGRGAHVWDCMRIWGKYGGEYKGTA